MEAIEAVSKLVLLVLLTQMGKTFTTIERISTEIENDEEFGRSIHMVYTMNTLLNGRQFAKRLNILESTYGEGSIVIFASKYTGPYKHVSKLNELLGLCIDNSTCPRVIVMCSNEFRFEDGVKFIEILNNNRTNIERVFTYFDELHKYISPKLRGQIEYIHELEIVKCILALTATPLNIWQKTGFWSNIRMLNLDEFNLENYAGYKDMIFNCIDNFFESPYIRPSPFAYDIFDEQTIGFVRYVLHKHPDILNNGSRTFIPGHIRRKGHDRIRNMVFETNNRAVVVVLNGKEKTLNYFDRTNFMKTIDLGNSTDDKEVCQVIADLIIKHNLVDRPLVITGFLCVGMGQTLTHNNLGSFTSAIFSHMDLTNDEIYQLFGRITGRMKNWGDKYIQTQVYCPTPIMHRCHVMEECARNVANEYNGEMIGEDKYLETMQYMGDEGISTITNIRIKKEKKEPRPKRIAPVEHLTPFTCINDVNKFLTDIFKKPTTIKFHKMDGYELSTRLVAYYKKKKNELTADDRLTYDYYRVIPGGMNISSTEGKGQQYMVYPVYETKESLPSSVKYYVRYLVPSSQSNPTNTIVNP